MSNITLSVENLTKRYDLGVIGTGTLSRDINRWWARLRGQPDPYTRIGKSDPFERFGESILALDDVSFTVAQGEALGIIGANGAGKSTLLKILSRVTAPTSGVVKVKGRIGSLLEVGTGFHPELTGRENVYLNGAILGMRKDEVDSKFDEIIEFSGVEKFIDTPVKRYSSGMYVRLAFAVAAHLDPEILVVDEVLAVGDAEFQKKCLGKMGDVADEGRTVLFVSHNMGAIKNLCQNAFLLDSGKIINQGSSDRVINTYLSSMKNNLGTSNHNNRSGNGPFRFTHTWLEDNSGNEVNSVEIGEPFSIIAEYSINSGIDFDDPSISIVIKNSYGSYISQLWNQAAGFSWKSLPTNGKIICRIPRCSFAEGVYSFDIKFKNNYITQDYIKDAGSFEVIWGDFFGTGQLPRKKYSSFLMEQIWEVKP